MRAKLKHGIKSRMKWYPIYVKAIKADIAAGRVEEEEAKAHRRLLKLLKMVPFWRRERAFRQLLGLLLEMAVVEVEVEEEEGEEA